MAFKRNFLSLSLLILLSTILKVNTHEVSSSVIIIGAGSSGLATASRLFQNGFNNIKILEAENRIGGRVYTRKFSKKKTVNLSISNNIKRKSAFLVVDYCLMNHLNFFLSIQ